MTDGAINVALYHCLGPSIQTALFNAPLVIIVSWCLGKPLDLNFEIFLVTLLVFAILVVGNFLRDGESNWLEGALLVVSKPPLPFPSFATLEGRACNLHLRLRPSMLS